MSGGLEVHNLGAKIRLQFAKGIYFPLVFDLYDEDGELLDLTGYGTPRLTIRASNSESATALVTKSGSITDATNGEVTFLIEKTDTDHNAFDELSGYYSAKIPDTSAKPHQFAYGNVDFEPEIDQQ